MISSLHIRNYALIEQIDIEFDKGLNIITGETGAGKSIILGALNLLLGERADTRIVRDNKQKSIIEAEFIIETPDEFSNFFKDKALDFDSDIVILRREITSTGRSRAFINDSPVTLAVLREIAIHLVDIHSQHQNMLLADENFQLQIIDALADNKELLSQYQKAYAGYRIILNKYASTRDILMRGRDQADFIEYQLNELNDLQLSVGEQTNLETERDRLQDDNAIKATIVEALEPFSDESQILHALDSSADRLRELSDSLDEANNLADRLETAINELRDIASSLEIINDRHMSDPMRLDAVESRLRKIYALEQKHHVDTDAALIELCDKLSSQLEAINGADDLIGSLELQAKQAKRQAMTIALQLSERRMTAAANFAEELRQTALPLGMNNLQCQINVKQGRLNSSGIDSVEFLFAFNKNQRLMGVGDTASGGEISRLMLAIKAIVGRKLNLPSIIFDEIDTGVSGDIATRIGHMMENIASHIQVITITHLPQVAARGNAHFKVYKEDNQFATATRLRKLNGHEREAEIALMLSGSSDDTDALSVAKTLLSS